MSVEGRGRNTARGLLYKKEHSIDAVRTRNATFFPSTLGPQAEVFDGDDSL